MPPVAGHVYTVQVQEVAHSLFYSGSIQPLHTSVVASPVDGFVLRQVAAYGQSVGVKQSLFVLKAPEVVAEFSDALISYVKAKDNLSLSAHKFSGEKELWKAGVISANEYADDQSHYESAYIDYFKALSKLRRTARLIGRPQGALERLNLQHMKELQTELNRHPNVTIGAAHAGVLLAPSVDKSAKQNTRVEVGGKISKGQALGVLADQQGVRVQVAVGEVDINTVKTGMQAYVTGAAFPGIRLAGKVHSVNLYDTAQEQAHGAAAASFPVVVLVPKLSADQRQQIQVGMSAKVELVTDKHRALMVPWGAIEQRQGKVFVWRMTATDDKQRIPVVVGRTTAQRVEIRQGLRAGDKVWVRD